MGISIRFREVKDLGSYVIASDLLLGYSDIARKEDMVLAVVYELQFRCVESVDITVVESEYIISSL